MRKLTVVITEMWIQCQRIGANGIYAYALPTVRDNVSVYTYTYTVDDITAPTVLAWQTALQCTAEIYLLLQQQLTSLML
jgi:hypothetical protein